MSDIPVPPSVVTPAQRDSVIASAKSLPDLITKAEAFDPDLAAKLKGQATIASATPVGALIGGAVGVLATRYGLGWDPDMVNTVSGALVLVGGYVAHWVQARMTSIVPPKS